MKYILINKQVLFTDLKGNEFEGYVLKTEKQNLDIFQIQELVKIIYKDAKGNYEIVKVPMSCILGMHYN